MRMTLSIPDRIARRFQAAVPAQQRSQLVTRLLENELSKLDDTLSSACLAANLDKGLNSEIQEWQSFDDRVEE
ncbi:MAG: hypothetical protein L3J39_15295 [Verrucomicrobiales bacterium]|nr:hypothetical protein [Verrucomicrobiales bacterium]